MSGKTPTCMESGLINGLIEECLQENMTMIKSMDLEFMHGQMIENTKDGGRKGSKMD